MKRFLPLLLILFFSCASKISYQGEKNSDGKYHGKGVITYRNGDKWEGEFRDGKPFNGKGTYQFPDSSKYKGEFKNGLQNGQGTYTWPNGSKYIGEWIDSDYNGKGTFTWPDGRKYIGEWKDSKKNGQGTFTWPDGRKYVGEHTDDSITGKGVTFEINGEIKSGIWTNGNLQDKWTFEAVESFLKNTYPQFKGFDYETPTTSVSLPKPVLPSSPEKPLLIAVVDFSGNNVSVGDCRALTDRLRSELFNTKYFKVIEREMMDEIIKEQGFQQSGCTTDECMVQVGKLIGVEKIVGGSISQVGNVYSVSARIVSIETGEIENTAVYDHIGNIGELLTEGMMKVAVRLVE